MDRAQLKSRLDDALRLLALAEGDLDTGMRALGVTGPVEKTAIARVLEDAFTKLRQARQDVADIERLILAADPQPA